MGYLNHPAQLLPARAPAWQKPSVLRRVLHGMHKGWRRDSERLWTDLIARNGGRLTDDVERQIGLHL